ncbi:MAG: AAA family ATPase, partial [Caldimonas sp.]
MYAQFFGLKQEPFSIAPDPRYLFMSKRHREALAHLLYGLNGGGGFVLLSGEIGAGKTTVCRCFLEQIPKNCNVAYIFNPKLTVNELLKSICDEFGIAVAPQGAGSATVKDYLDPLNAFLLKTHAVGQNNVLIIDEAQMLSADVLEQLRLLTNLETNERKLLQIVLIGQPELRTMLAQPELEQLAQRVIARFHLKALSDAETTLYIRHRLAVGGMTRGMPFERHAIERIHVLSRGIPRRINLLCDRALLGAYARGTHRVTREIVDRAATEVFGRSEPARASRRRPRHLALLALGIGVVAAAAIYAGSLLMAGRGARHSATAGAGIAASAASARAASTAALSGSVGAGASAAASGTASAPTTATSAPAAGASVPLASSQVSARTLADIATSTPRATATDATPALAKTAAAAPTAASAPAAPPKFLAANDLKAAFKTVVRDERQAWRELALLWNLELGNGEPCEAAQHHQVRCFKSASSLDFVRKLGRPGIVDLRDDSGHT